MGEEAEDLSLTNYLESAYDEHDEPEETPEVEDTPDLAASGEGEAPSDDIADVAVGDGKEEQAELQGEEAEAGEAGEAEGTAAPQSWDATAREHWKDVPDGVKEFIHKREKDFSYQIQKNTEAANAGRQFMDTLRPYESIMRMEGATPVQAIANMANVAAVMRQGTPQEKVEMFADFIGIYGVDLNMLDSALTTRMGGQVDPNQPAGQPDIQGMIRQEMAPLVNQFTNQQQAQRQQQESAAVTDIQQFAATAEFINDVRMDMADLMDLAESRGQRLTLQDAYAKACAMNPQVSSVLSQRNQAQQVNQAAQALEAKRNAASSITGQPAGGGGTGAADTLRGTLEQAWSGG